MAVRQGNLENMTGGWFVGGFRPTMLDTQDVEVAVKHYRAGDHESEHFHRVATEVTVVVSGEVAMAGRKLVANDVIVLEPGEATDFRALRDSTTVVVKVPGALNDKYIVD